MERPMAYTDVLFAHGLSYVYEVSIKLMVDYLNETLEFYLGQTKPPRSKTLIFRAGGMHYSATRSIIREETSIAQKRIRDTNF